MFCRIPRYTRKKKAMFVLLAMLIVVFFYTMTSPTLKSKDATEDIERKHSKTFRSPTVSSYKNIFFIETSCLDKSSRDASDKMAEIKLNARQACAIESAARSNPHAEVYLLHTCRVDAHRLVGSKRYVREVFSYPNVFAHHVDLVQFVRDTPLGDWDTDELLVQSKYPVEHGADVMRLVALWKYGGIYLDLDVVVLKSLRHLRSNFAGFESDKAVCNAVLSADAGHQLMTDYLHQIRDAYDPKEYFKNGPTLLTSMLMKYCNVTQVLDISHKTCKGFTVYRPEYFYFIPFNDYNKYVDPELDVPRAVRELRTFSYITHTWNFFSKDFPVDTGKVHLYGALASRYCPSVYKEAGRTF